MAQLPPPFQRPGVTLSDGIKREWKDVPVSSLFPGVLVRLKGAVEAIYDAPGGYVVYWKNGSSSSFDEGDVVNAFVQVSD